MVDESCTDQTNEFNLGRQMSDMASYLNKQKHESLEALTCAADAEGRLHTANERYVVSFHYFRCN